MSSTLTELPTQRQVLKNTISRCPVCLKPSPARVWVSGGPDAQTGRQKVYLERTCPEHGAASHCISSDARFYWLSTGRQRDESHGESSCCAGGNCCAVSGDGTATGALGRNALLPPEDATLETLSTCLALIEIVDSCNLACPTCYADSPVGGSGGALKFHPLDSLQARIQGVIDRKGGIEILQLSGGEPTLHPQFFELLRWAHDHPKIDYVLLNTNGIRIAKDPSFAERLGNTFRYGGFQLYLQFDGLQEAGHHELRGADLREAKRTAVERCGELGIPVTLAMTVTAANLPHLWESIEFGLSYAHVRGVSFQPLFGSGRLPGPDKTPTRLNTADIILGAVEQSAGRLRFEDFTPLPCGDPNCATIGYLLKIGGEVRSISDFIDFSEIQGFLRDKVRYNLADLSQCGCESEPLGALLKQFELDERHTFRLFIKPFMDAWNWDEDRIDRCCTHVIRPDGKLDSFCRYYSGFPDTATNPSAAANVT